MQVNADSPENLLQLATTLNALDRNGICTGDIVSFDSNSDNIFTATELSPDPYDPTIELKKKKGPSWWQSTEKRCNG